MATRRIKRVLLSVVLGLVFCGLALFVFSGWAAPDAQAQPSSTCRARINDGPIEYANVQAAVDAADDGDLVKVAGYCDQIYAVRGGPPAVGGPSVITQVVYISRPLTIRGGYTFTNWATSRPITQPTVLDPQGLGRGLFITGTGSVTISGLTIRNGDAGMNGGGGISVWYADATISNTTVISCSAGSGGGIGVWKGQLTLLSSKMFSNTALMGGGVYLYQGTADLRGNTILGNRAYEYGYTGSSIQPAGGGGGGIGGGVDAYQSVLTMTGNTVVSNAAIGNLARAGGVAVYESTANLRGNTILSNTTTMYGGGVLVVIGDLSAINNIVAQNQATQGGGFFLSGAATGNLIHNTISNNSPEGVMLSDLWSWWGDSTVYLTNTILVSHTKGITVAQGSAAVLEATLWGDGEWVNAIDWDGDGTIVTGALNYWGDPKFVDPAGGDYHITADSAAIDRAIPTSVTVDIDGEPRNSDLGADEYHPPTSVTLVSFSATTSGTAVLLEWETGTEIDVLGFNLWREVKVKGKGECYERLGDVPIGGFLISASYPGQPCGSNYAYLDKPPACGQHRYKLEVVKTTGSREFYGPISVTALCWLYFPLVFR